MSASVQTGRARFSIILVLRKAVRTEALILLWWWNLCVWYAAGDGVEDVDEDEEQGHQQVHPPGDEVGRDEEAGPRDDNEQACTQALTLLKIILLHGDRRKTFWEAAVSDSIPLSKYNPSQTSIHVSCN